MRPKNPLHQRRATVLVLIIGLLTMLFMMLASFLTLARSERQAVVQVERGAQAEGIVDNLSDVLASINVNDGLIGDGGRAYTRIPGYADASWLASNNPYRSSSTIGDPPSDGINYAAVTSLSGPLVRDSSTSRGPSIRELSFENPNLGALTEPAWRQRLARQPSMDADGDGVPDSDFIGSAMATQLANAIGGRSVNANTAPDPNIYPRWRDPNSSLWRLFTENARYEAAARIISHGGMVQISSPTETRRWNTGFLFGMFNYLQDTRDNAANLDPTAEGSGSDISLVNALYSQRAEAEAFLRYRGGILSPKNLNEGSSGVTAIDQLAKRIAGYGATSYTFFPSYQEEANFDAYQRFNLADNEQRQVWLRAVSRDPRDPSTDLAKRLYAERRDLTTVNNSDELARKQSFGVTTGQATELRLTPGSLKFYLGRATSAFTGVSGVFTETTTASELAAVFGEMLASYIDWRQTPNVVSILEPPVTRAEQARMLAVNTLAFAAPYTGDPNAGIAVDVPWIAEERDNGKFMLYFGAGPQPYITQAMVYKAEDATDPNIFQNTAAIELFNPHDFKLDPSRFGISIETSAAGTPDIKQLDPNATLSASGLNSLQIESRKFSLLLVDDGSNTWFRDGGQNYDGITGADVPLLANTNVPTSNDLLVRLWRLASTRPPQIAANSAYAYGSGMWVLVDEFKCVQPDDRPPTWGSDPNDPNSSGPWPGSYVDTWRDTQSEAYWVNNAAGRAPRWRVVMPADDEKNEKNTKPDQTRLNDLGDNGPTFTAATSVPTTPLYTMTPVLGAVYTPEIHGARRPSAFPTVGFMHFIGRFSHTFSNNIGNLKEPWITANQWLEYAWESENKSLRADLAFMPVFSNRQRADATSEFSDDPKVGAGRIPWGLLVYDYFSTLNTGDPDGDGDAKDALDPMRVDGRININTAPWHVLAALPVIGPEPNTASYPYDLPLNRTTASSLRDYTANMLNGVGPTAPRLLQLETGSGLVDPNQDGWYHLGNGLGQALASYRDGVNYTDSSSSDAFFYRTVNRNYNEVTLGPDYRPQLYADPNNLAEQARGGVRDPNYTGFLSVGELLNIKGFDATKPQTGVMGLTSYSLGQGDYIRAISLLALLDTHFLTTRSNTYTAYFSLMDRENPASSVYSQVSFDRSDMIPRTLKPNGIETDPNIVPWSPSAKPEIISERRMGYFSTSMN